ncbi:Mitochondrial ATP synthase subunit OSCP subunit [Fasciola hepatica]|uniref:Oligomycin sensitivity conferral protein n=1 Tax=Fasciola hepatica TaxID=6192 RepID=A0A4E0RZJ6_FASHE|nr:Mitochondrial ATP synthase subunit OSCP subunit [Fasciola hepatica]
MFSQAIRRFSTSPSLQKLVLPPVQVFGVEGRYATALYSAASKMKTLDAVEKDLNTIRDTLAKDARLREFCVNPSLQRATKVIEFAKVLDKLKVNPQTKNMLVTLTENGRLGLISAVLEKFAQIMSAHRGEVTCVVRTAKTLDRTTEQELRTALNEFLKPGEKLNLTLELDPSLIGGMVVSIGDRFVDMSIARKVRTYREALEQPL